MKSAAGLAALWGGVRLGQECRGQEVGTREGLILGRKRGPPHAQASRLSLQIRSPGRPSGSRLLAPQTQWGKG